jgi:hypothetical protein
VLLLLRGGRRILLVLVGRLVRGGLLVVRVRGLVLLVRCRRPRESRIKMERHSKDAASTWVWAWWVRWSRRSALGRAQQRRRRWGLLVIH